MTIAEQLKRYQEIWAVLIPHIVAPEPPDMILHKWHTYPVQFMEKAILRTSMRYAEDKVTPDFDPQDAYKYTAFIAIEAVKRQKELALKKLANVRPAPVMVPDIDDDDNRGNRC